MEHGSHGEGEHRPAGRGPLRRTPAKTGSRRPRLRLALLLAVFAGLTALGIWWASPSASALAGAWAAITALPAGALVALGLLAPGLIAAEMIRLVVMGRALGVRVGFWAALDATVANNFFSWITPGAALGEPAATYMLGRRGVPWDAAVLIAFGKFALSFALIFGAAFALVALGYGPPIPGWVLAPIAAAVGAFALLLAALIAGAFWPARSVAIVDRIEARLSRRRRRPAVAAIARTARESIERLARFRQAGTAMWLAIAGSQLLYHGIFVGVLVTLGAALEGGAVASIAPRAVIYQGFLYLAPTPGSSGLGEAGAGVFFGDALGAGGAFTAVIAFRALTYYLHVVLGLVYLPLAGGIRAILGDQAREPGVADPQSVAGEADRADRGGGDRGGD